VRYSECDAQGVVFNAHYLSYFDIGMTELWRAAFGSYGAMTERGVDIVVAETQIRFQAPARFDDVLTLEVSIAQLGTSSMITEHRVLRGRQSLTQATMRHVFVELATMGKTAIPDWARSALAPWVVGPR
jgi:acyl-CoA thioester hydrolase